MQPSAACRSAAGASTSTALWSVVRRGRQRRHRRGKQVPMAVMSHLPAPELLTAPVAASAVAPAGAVPASLAHLPALAACTPAYQLAGLYELVDSMTELHRPPAPPPPSHTSTHPLQIGGGLPIAVAGGAILMGLNLLEVLLLRLPLLDLEVRGPPFSPTKRSRCCRRPTPGGHPLSSAVATALSPTKWSRCCRRPKGATVQLAPDVCHLTPAQQRVQVGACPPHRCPPNRCAPHRGPPHRCPPNRCPPNRCPAHRSPPHLCPPNRCPPHCGPPHR